MDTHIHLQGDDFKYEDDISLSVAGFIISKIGQVRELRKGAADRGRTLTDEEILRRIQ